MSERNMKQILAQLPEGSRILRAYRAIEGDIRVIVKIPGGPPETRYTVKWEDPDYAKIELMP